MFIYLLSVYEVIWKLMMDISFYERIHLNFVKMYFDVNYNKRENIFEFETWTV